MHDKSEHILFLTANCVERVRYKSEVHSVDSFVFSVE